MRVYYKSITETSGRAPASLWYNLLLLRRAERVHQPRHSTKESIVKRASLYFLILTIYYPENKSRKLQIKIL